MAPVVLEISFVSLLPVVLEIFFSVVLEIFFVSSVGNIFFEPTKFLSCSKPCL